MLQLEPLRQFPNGEVVASRESFDGQQCLVLLRRQPGLLCGLFAKVQKSAQCIAECRQRFILGFGKRFGFRHAKAFSPLSLELQAQAEQGGLKTAQPPTLEVSLSTTDC